MDFTGLAVADLASPSYDYGTRTCSGVYCHGATRADGTNTAPIWTGGPLGCSSCHGNPPLSVAPHSASTTDCSICHTAVPGPDHLDGDVDVVTVHPAGYATPTAHGPDAIAGIATCQSCHGTDFGGDVGPSCNDCHDDYGWSATALTTNCAFCHGTKDVTTKPTFDFASAPALAAPPEAVDGDPSNPSIGAHQAHLLGESYSSGFACAECHTVPADLDHIADGEAGAEIVFGPLASAGGVTPSYDTGNCTTYCHGETLLGGTAATPSWTATTLACNACHGQPPDTSLHEFHVISEGAACDDCHIGYFAGTGVNLAYHVNAVKDVVFLKAGGAPGETYTHSTGWGDCTGCHTNNANYQVDP
jgi:predicted CxxxxCH...CXXCH cytochrome family protein